MKLTATALLALLYPVKGQKHLRPLRFPESVEIKEVTQGVGAVVQYDQPNRRKFLSYESSEWEKLWLEKVDHWATHTQICQVLRNNQQNYIHDFLNLTCTSRYEAPFDHWCIIDDEYHPLWYNTANRNEFELSWTLPGAISPYAKLMPAQPVLPTAMDEHVVSKFTFLDELTGETYVEYIEPLVSHLRHPLAKCIDIPPVARQFKYYWTVFRGYVIPPPPLRGSPKNYYFDAGASSWGDGSGGPSLKYFWNIWARHSIDWNNVFAYEMTTSVDEFYQTLPVALKDTIHYQQCAVSSSPNDDSPEHPFLPLEIKRRTSKDDYVFFKLDIDSPSVEDGNIYYILNDPDNHIDEVAWEHHIRGNYLLTEWGPPEKLPDVSMRESYEMFLQMRLKGIRAHSWI